jgi:hypothetical protein
MQIVWLAVFYQGTCRRVIVRSMHASDQSFSLPQAGMTSINDFATTYMCQSLPFGGVKDSGFDRFAGIEGLRGLTIPKAVAEDRFANQYPLFSP